MQEQNHNDERSDVFRQTYQDLTSDQKDDIMRVKNLARMMNEFLDNLKPSREVSLAKTKLEECVMWATKSITK
jgi:hypothetical protein